MIKNNLMLWVKVTVVALMVCASMTMTEEQNVLVLTDSDFPGIFEEYPKILVQFYAPWCGHCKRLAPVYIEAAAQLKALNSTVRLAKVDCDSETKAKETYGVKGFPTLIFFNEGVQVPYNSPRTQESIVKWLVKREKSPVQKITSQQLEELKKEKKLFVVYHGDLESKEGKTVIEIALKDDHNQYFAVSGSSAKLQIIRDFADDISTDTINDETEAWIQLHDKPSVVPFDDRTIKSIFTDSGDGFVYFNSDQSKERSEIFKQVANKWRTELGNAVLFSEILPENQNYEGLSGYIKISPKEFPLIYIDGKNRKKTVFKAKDQHVFNQADVQEFLTNIKEEKTYGLDEKIPDSKIVQEEADEL